MRVLVIGAEGMLGHQLLESYKGRFELAATTRGPAAQLSSTRASGYANRLYTDIHVERFQSVEQVLDDARPQAVVNACGIVKQRAEAREAIQSLEVNALFPQKLTKACIERGVRLVHMSTDCVFSGQGGGYKDDSFSDANDLYGRTKYLGEVEGPGVVTLRTSIIGLELRRKQGLIEWFLAQRGTVPGFTRAVFSGFTTKEMTAIIELVLTCKFDVNGIYNVSSRPIDKYSLLCMLRERIRNEVHIVPDDRIVCDRSLDSTKFRDEFSYVPPSWDSMMDELAEQILHRQI